MKTILSLVVVAVLATSVHAVPPDPNPTLGMRARLIYGLLKNELDGDGDIAPLPLAQSTDKYTEILYNHFGLAGVGPLVRDQFADVDGNLLPWASLSNALKGKYFINHIKKYIRDIRHIQIGQDGIAAAKTTIESDRATAAAEQDTDIGAEE